MSEKTVGEGDWIPVKLQSRQELPGAKSKIMKVGAVLLLRESGVEAVPGLWAQEQQEGFVFVVPKESEVSLKDGEPVAAVADAAAEQVCCASCGLLDAKAWVGGPTCATCGEKLVPPGGLAACPSCHAALMKGVQAGCHGCGSAGWKLRKGAGGKQGVFALLAKQRRSRGKDP